MFVVFKSINNKIYIEEGINNFIGVFGVERRGVRKVFIKEMLFRILKVNRSFLCKYRR